MLALLCYHRPCVYKAWNAFFYLFTKDTKSEARAEAYLGYFSTFDHLELEGLQQSMYRPHLQVSPSRSD